MLREKNVIQENSISSNVGKEQLLSVSEQSIQIEENSNFEQKDENIVDCKNIAHNEEEITKNWSIYRDDFLKFSFKYPSNWNYTKNDNVNNDNSVKTISFYKPNTKCFIEGSLALCGVTVSISPIRDNENSPNKNYLKILEKANTPMAPIIMQKICNSHLNVIGITDYLRHEFVFDYNGHSFSFGSENFGSDDVNKEFWDNLDIMLKTFLIQ